MWPRARELPTRFAPTTHWKLFLREDKQLPGASQAAARAQARAPHHRHSTAVRRVTSSSPLPTGLLGSVHTHVFGRGPPATQSLPQSARVPDPRVEHTKYTPTSGLIPPLHRPFRSIQIAKRQSAVKSAATSDQQQDECQLPMDMECGCKTKREKERQEQEALQRAEQRRVEQTQGNQQREHDRMHAMVQKAPAVQSSFHRRHLPQDCIAFSSPEGRKLFTEAINSSGSSNYMQIYFPLAEQFITQAEPAYCGLATLAMCLNALQIDPGRLWKGPWRWFSEELFDCCTSLSVAKEKGISMSEFICLARCNGVLTEDYRATSDFTLEQFRDIVKHSCATSSEIVVLNYSRKVLGQTGDGHFSPIGGYHAERDMVLLMDVARFKYPPHWVKLSRVFDAMQRIDQSMDLPRGLVILREGAHATGPTLVKQQLIHCDEQMAAPVAPAPQPCCYSSAAVEAARRMADPTVTTQH
ncbi:putative glutathione gamma-glutamylcysteinyltransferase [Phytophthora cinnamomi]|uniref:putative glutathione gamma-glutamylcysteinyltransferase n=1 Tax=Phytophthora cinnamomi TaxID=4785 RepID=UPI003559B29F|nr:putative glutathione gamma-glutamylcysteinyltransferase [Phytophthora cinnamomi]